MVKVGNSALYELYLGSIIAERKLHKMGHKMSNRNEYRNLTEPFLEFVSFCFHSRDPKMDGFRIPFFNFDDSRNVSVTDDFI